MTTLWSCRICTYLNQPSETLCEICGTANKVHYTKSIDNAWNCVLCTLKNTIHSESCFICGAPSPLHRDLSNKQICIYCTAINGLNTTHCIICREPFNEITAESSSNEEDYGSTNINDNESKVEEIQEDQPCEERFAVYLVSTFLSNIERDHPAEIAKLCIQFYFEYDPMTFKFISEKEMAMISENKTRIICKDSSYCAAKGSRGWYRGLHSFTMKVNECGSGSSIGIISNSMRIYYDGYIGEIRTMYNTSKHFSVLSYAPKWQSKDRITVSINCDERSMRFYVNGEVVNKLILQYDDEIKYPLVQGSCFDFKFVYCNFYFNY